MKQAGFTLIEVVVALAILAISLTATLIATADNIRNTGRLENETIATWIAVDIVHQYQLGLLTTDQQNKSIHVLNNDWVWSANTSTKDHLETISVDVQKQIGGETLAHLEGYHHD